MMMLVTQIVAVDRRVEDIDAAWILPYVAANDEGERRGRSPNRMDSQ